MLNAEVLVAVAAAMTSVATLWLMVLFYLLVKVRRAMREMPEFDGMMDDMAGVGERAQRRRRGTRARLQTTC